MLQSIYSFRRRLKACLAANLVGVQSACVFERMTIIFETGLRKGSKGSWVSCFDGHFIRGEADTASAQFSKMSKTSQGPPSISVVLDEEFPDFDVLEVREHLRRILTNIPFFP
jgi:hypothetical protein